MIESVSNDFRMFCLLVHLLLLKGGGGGGGGGGGFAFSGWYHLAYVTFPELGTGYTFSRAWHWLNNLLSVYFQDIHASNECIDNRKILGYGCSIIHASYPQTTIEANWARCEPITRCWQDITIKDYVAPGKIQKDPLKNVRSYVTNFKMHTIYL